MIRLDQPRRQKGESVVPMINVAFLLLIFFLMVAVLSPPDPIAVTLPDAMGEDAQTPDAARVLIVAGDGRVVTQDGRAASLTNFAGQSVLLRADAQVDGGRIAAIIAELSAGGVESVQLAVAPN